MNNVKYKRLFGFGCSYTSYFWPTWVDIIGKDLDIPYENWGICGLGNVGIGHRMVECDIKNNFQEDDLIITTWSTWHREDRYLTKGWTMNGNIFNDNVFYHKKWRNKFWHPNNDIIKNVGMLYLANKSFKINYQANIIESDTLTYSGNVMDFYKPFVPTDSFPWKPQEDQSFEGTISHVDNHPDIVAHLDYVEKNIYPVLGLKLKEETKEHFINLQQTVINDLRNRKKKRIKHWSDLKEYFLEVLGTSWTHIGI